MNAFTADFSRDFVGAAKGLVWALENESGLHATPHIVAGPEGNVLLFTTEEANGATLGRFLVPILNGAVNPRSQQGEPVTIDPDYCPDHLVCRGSVAVDLSPSVIGYLSARLEQKTWNPR